MQPIRSLLTVAVVSGIAALIVTPVVSGADQTIKANNTDVGIDLSYIDHSVKPGDDFFSYANGAWVKTAQIPADRSQTGPTQELEDLTAKRTADLIQNMAKTHPAAGTNNRKIADFYATYMDEAGIEKRGLTPIKAQLDAIDAIKTRDVLERVRKQLNEAKPVRTLGLDANERAVLRDMHLLTDKPIMYVANVDENGFTDNPRLDRVRELAKAEGAVVVPVCAAIEAEISQLDEADRGDFLKELKLDEPGLNRVIRGGYSLLGLQTYFTAGPKEVRAWTVHRGATAPQAAGVIHTDFEHGFIRAEVIAYDDFIANKGEAGAKEAGKLRLEGKEYIVREGDVMHFRFNV